MENKLKLFMVLMGCTPKGRLTEQHDVFFGIGVDLPDLLPQMSAFWPEVKGKFHIDAWREITNIDNYTIEIVERTAFTDAEQHLYFLNLGGYKPNEFEEYHYKMLAVSKKMASAIRSAKKTSFYKHCGFDGAISHIDEKYGIDVDNIYKVADILSPELKSLYAIKICPMENPGPEDALNIGYTSIKSLKR